MHVRCTSVAGFPIIDDDHRSALTAQLERGGKSSNGSADDGDVAVPFDDVGDVVTHDK